MGAFILFIKRDKVANCAMIFTVKYVIKVLNFLHLYKLYKRFHEIFGLVFDNLTHNMPFKSDQYPVISKMRPLKNV